MNMSVVIPTFSRQELLKTCLNAVLKQTSVPFEIIIIDNEGSVKTEVLVKGFEPKFQDVGSTIRYLKNEVNSGAIARNIGIEYAQGDLIAFLDDDVVLAEDYYELVSNAFKSSESIMGIQGFDKAFALAATKINGLSFDRFLYEFEKYFQISNFYDSKPRVTNSFCVVNPLPTCVGLIPSGWISTCAGVYRREALEKNRFDSKLMKYSWNEYVDLSIRVSRMFPASLRFLSEAKYEDAQVFAGRMSNVELMYMANVYDLYLFFKLMKRTPKSWFDFWFSKIGRLIYNLLRAVRRLENPMVFFHCVASFIYPLLHLKEIKNADLSFFDKKFNL